MCCIRNSSFGLSIFLFISNFFLLSLDIIYLIFTPYKTLQRFLHSINVARIIFIGICLIFCLTFVMTRINGTFHTKKGNFAEKILIIIGFIFLLLIIVFNWFDYIYTLTELLKEEKTNKNIDLNEQCEEDRCGRYSSRDKEQNLDQNSPKFAFICNYKMPTMSNCEEYYGIVSPTNIEAFDIFNNCNQIFLCYSQNENTKLKNNYFISGLRLLKLKINTENKSAFITITIVGGFLSIFWPIFFIFWIFMLKYIFTNAEYWSQFYPNSMNSEKQKSTPKSPDHQPIVIYPQSINNGQSPSSEIQSSTGSRVWNLPYISLVRVISGAFKKTNTQFEIVGANATNRSPVRKLSRRNSRRRSSRNGIEIGNLNLANINGGEGVANENNNVNKLNNGGSAFGSDTNVINAKKINNEKKSS